METRKAIYEELGSKKISTDNRKPKEIATEVLELIG
jgi:shikimate kinase